MRASIVATILFCGCGGSSPPPPAPTPPPAKPTASSLAVDCPQGTRPAESATARWCVLTEGGGRHGPYVGELAADGGPVTVRGQFEQCAAVGEWVYTDAAGKRLRSETYVCGVLETIDGKEVGTVMALGRCSCDPNAMGGPDLAWEPRWPPG